MDKKLIRAISVVENRSPSGALFYIKRMQMSNEKKLKLKNADKKMLLKAEKGKRKWKQSKNLDKIMCLLNITEKEMNLVYDKNDAICEKIKTFRISQNLSINSFAKKINGGASYLMNVEKKTFHPTNKYLNKIITSFKLPNDYFKDCKTFFSEEVDFNELVYYIKNFYKKETYMHAACYAARKIRKLSMSKCAKLMNVSKQKLFDCEHSASIDMDFIKLYSVLLEYDLTQFLFL